MCLWATPSFPLPLSPSETLTPEVVALAQKPSFRSVGFTAQN